MVPNMQREGKILGEYASESTVSLASYQEAGVTKTICKDTPSASQTYKGDPRDAENQSRAYNRHIPGFLSEDGGGTREAETLTERFCLQRLLTIIKNLQSQYISFPKP